MARPIRTLAIDSHIADRLALAAVQQRQRAGHPVTQRSLAEQAIEDLLGELEKGHAMTWPALDESPSRSTRTLGIDTHIADRLALAAVQQRPGAGRSVSMREVAELAITRLLDKQGEP